MSRAKPKTARPTKVPLSFRVPFDTKRDLEDIARCASVSVDQVVTVIIATRVVTERKARERELQSELFELLNGFVINEQHMDDLELRAVRDKLFAKARALVTRIKP